MGVVVRVSATYFAAVAVLSGGTMIASIATFDPNPPFIRSSTSESALQCGQSAFVKSSRSQRPR